MKSYKVLKIIICFCFIYTMSVHALTSKEYIRWSKGEFEIPPDIKKMTTINELQPFIETKDSLTQIAAVRRLSEIEVPNLVDSLISIYEKEKPTRGNVEFCPLVKLEVIRSLDRIGTEQAKNALIVMLKELWEKGPTLNEKRKDKGYFYYDCDFMDCIPLLLQTLYKWSSDKDVYELVSMIVSSDDVKNYYHNIGQRAWETYLKGEMINKSVVDEKESAQYLLDYIGDIRNKGIDSVELGSTKVAAANTILKRQSEAALSYLVSEFENQFKNEPRGPNGSLTENHKILRNKIGTLKNILKERQVKTEMQEEKPAEK